MIFWPSQYFTPDPNIAGDDKSHYWSSTAVSGSSEAYIGDGTPKDRDLEYRVIAVRKKKKTDMEMRQCK